MLYAAILTKGVREPRVEYKSSEEVSELRSDVLDYAINKMNLQAIEAHSPSPTAAYHYFTYEDICLIVATKVGLQPRYESVNKILSEFHSDLILNQRSFAVLMRCLELEHDQISVSKANLIQNDESLHYREGMGILFSLLGLGIGLAVGFIKDTYGSFYYQR